MNLEEVIKLLPCGESIGIYEQKTGNPFVLEKQKRLVWDDLYVNDLLENGEYEELLYRDVVGIEPVDSYYDNEGYWGLAIIVKPETFGWI